MRGYQERCQNAQRLCHTVKYWGLRTQGAPVGCSNWRFPRERGLGDYMGRKHKICVPKLLDGLVGHLPPESVSPGFCLLPSIRESGVLLSSQ